MWLTAWFRRCRVNIEAASDSFSTSLQRSEFPDDTELSEYGKGRKNSILMKNPRHRVPYTPFVVLLSKYHGRMTFWRECWRHFSETRRYADVRSRSDIPGSRWSGSNRDTCAPRPTATVDYSSTTRTISPVAYPVIFVPGDVE
jgi:hypothetical protein